MTEGAKTGARELCLYCQYPIANQQEWDDIPPGEGFHLCWGVCSERHDVESLLRQSRSDLTEALKVAGEAQYFVQQLLADLPAKRDWLNPDTERALKDFTNSAALERIRTKGTPPEAATKEHETEQLYPEGGFDFGGPEGEGW